MIIISNSPYFPPLRTLRSLVMLASSGRSEGFSDQHFFMSSSMSGSHDSLMISGLKGLSLTACTLSIISGTFHAM